MVVRRSLPRAAILMLAALASTVWYACSESAPPSAPVTLPDLSGAILVQKRYSDDLLAHPGVVGTAVTILPDGRPGVQLLLEHAGVPGLPATLDGVPVSTQVTGLLMAHSDPTERRRPAPMGYSVGHPDITAGTAGARVKDALGRVYILSNNHVLANSNDATLGDPEYQPGPFDGGTAADQIATLSDFQVINFTGGSNTIDAAIALTGTDVFDNSVPSDDGYGMPNSTIYDDLNGDGLIDDRNALLGLNVQKYGRTTSLTHGQITGVNATVSVCYEVLESVCIKQARYVDQLIITPPGFSNGGDSGSLIVTDDGNVNPVALLFAGSSTVTIGNRIDLVLNRFGVAIDGFAPLPPGPLTDIAVTGVNGAGSAVQGRTTSVTVTVKNFGNQDVPATFTVALEDTTEHVTVGTQSVAGLAVGASSNVIFSWTPTTTGDHTLVGRQSFADERATNDQRSTTIPVAPPTMDVAVTEFATPGNGVIVGHTVNIGVTIANSGNLPTGSFVLTLEDSTAGVTIGTQTVASLAPGASPLLVFSWNATGAALGPHTLVATHNLSDDDGENDRLTTVVAVMPKPTDIAATAISGPRSVFQGDTAHVLVTLQNVGEVDVTAPFAVQLTDGTAGGAVVGSRTVPGLAIGATTIVDVPWNTAGASISGHILIATQKLPDSKSTNDAIAISINVNAPVPPPPAIDIAVTSLTAPGSVSQGNPATVTVTVQNAGTQSVSGSFDIVLTDATAGTTIGTQSVTGIVAGASTTRSFIWTTSGATLGGHTLVATHTLADENAANNSRSTTVTVTPQPTDLAVTGITAPPRVNQGDIVPVAVTVQNVGGQDVTTSFDLVLTDASAGNAVLGTQTITGLAKGSSVTRSFTWNTAGAALSGHILFATQKLADNNSSNNSIGISVIVQTPPTTDLAVTSVTAPGTVTQGTSASISVAVQNVGGLAVASNFNLVLTDQTAGVTIGTQTIAGLGIGSNTTRTFTWNTTGAALGGHTLVATQTLNDANAANNQASATVTLIAPSNDVAVTSLSAPSSVNKGSTATIGVTVQNIGGLNVPGTFTVVLTDQSAGVTIGTQTVSGLAAGASATRSFSWNTATAALGGHTLVATHSLSDDNAGNNQRSATVNVLAAPADIALASITAPGQVTVGDTAPLVVTVQNVGGQDVTANFDVVLTDGTAGNAVIGTQTIPGLALGASVTLTFSWNTTGAAVGGHILMATQKFVDSNSGNNAKAIVVSVNAPNLHVGNLGGSADTSALTSWTATVQITAHDSRHNPVNGVTVHGLWNGTGPEGTCVTSDVGGPGTCSVVLSGIVNSTRMVTFGITGMTLTGYVYKASANHDPDGSSNGFSMTVKRQ